MPRSNNVRSNSAKVNLVTNNSSKSAFVPIQSTPSKPTNSSITASTITTEAMVVLTPSSNKPPLSHSMPSPPTKGSNVNTGQVVSPRTQNISPQAVRNLSKSPEMSNTLATSPRGVNGKPLLPAEVTTLLGRMGETIGQGLFTVGSTVTAQATDVAFTVGSVMGDQTEIFMSQAVGTLPKYSENDVRQIMAKKDMLLNELSHTCLLLGIAEENKLELERQAESLRQKEMTLEEFTQQQGNQIAELEHELICVREEKESLLARFESIRTDDLSELEEWRSSATEQKEQSNRLLEQIAIIEEQLTIARDELQRERALYSDDKSTWEQQMNELGETQQSTRQEMEITFKNAMSQLIDTESQRDKLSAELDVLREVSSVDKLKFESEQAKYKETLASLQASTQQRLDDKENELQQSRLDASEWKLKADEYSTQLFTLMREKSDLEVKLTSADSNLNLSQVSYSLLEREIKEMKSNLTLTQKDLEEERKIRSTQNHRIQELEIENRFQLNKVKDLQEQLSLSGSKSAEFISDFQQKYEQKCHETRDLESKLAHADRLTRESELKYENSVQIWQQSMDLKEKDFQLHLQEIQMSHQGELQSLQTKLQVSADQLATHEREIARLVSILDSQKQQVESTSSQADVLKDQYLKEIASLHTEIEQHRSQVSEKDRIIDMLQARVSQVVSESSATVGHQSALVSSLQTELLAAKQSMEQANKTHQTSRTDTSNKLNAKSFEHLEIISKLKSELMALRADYNEVVNTQQSIVKTAGQMQDIMRRSSIDESTRLKDGFSLAQAEKDALIQRAHSLEKSLSETQDRCFILMTKEQEADMNIQALRLELNLDQSVSSQQSNSLHEKIISLTAKLQQAELALSTNIALISSLETEKIKLTQKVIDQAADLNEWKVKDTEMQSEIKNIHSQYLQAVQTHSEAVATLTSQVHTETESSVTLRLSSEYEVKLQLLKGELATWKERASAYEQSSSAAQAKFAQAGADLKQNYETNIAELMKKFDQTSENHASDRANLISTYERKLDELRQSSSDAAIQLQDAMRTHGSEQVRVYQSKIRVLQEELEKIQRLHGDERRGLEQAQTQAQMNASLALSDLQSKLDIVRLELESTQASLLAAEREKELLRSTSTSQAQEVASSQTADKQQIIRLEGQLLASNQSLAALEDALQLAKEQKSAMIASIREEQHTLDERVADLLRTNQKLTEQLSDTNRAYEVLYASTSSSPSSPSTEALESLTQQYQRELTAVRTEYSQRIESLEQEKHRVVDTLREIENRYSSLLATTSSLSHDTMIADLHARLVLEKQNFDSTAMKTKMEYEAVVNRLTKEIELSRQHSIKEFDRESNQLKEQLSFQQMHLQSVEAHLALMTKEKVILEQRVSELTSALNHPTTTNVHTQTSSTLESEQLAVVKQQVAAISTERDTLLTTLASKSKELDFNLSQMSNLKETVSLLEADYQALEKQRDEMVLVMEAQNSALEQAETRTKEQSTNKHKIDGLIATTEDRYRDLLKSAIAAEKVAVQNAKELQVELKNTTETLLSERRKQTELETSFKQEVEELSQHILEMEELLIQAGKEGVQGVVGDTDMNRLLQSSQRIRDREVSIVWHEKLVRLIAELRDAITVASIDSAAETGTNSSSNQNIVSSQNNSGGRGNTSSSAMSSRSVDQWERWEAINRQLHTLRLHVMSVIPGVDVVVQSSTSTSVMPERVPMQSLPVNSSSLKPAQLYNAINSPINAANMDFDTESRKTAVKGIVQAWKKMKESLSSMGQNISNSPSTSLRAVSPSARSPSAESYSSYEPLLYDPTESRRFIVSPTTSHNNSSGQASRQQVQFNRPGQYYSNYQYSEPSTHQPSMGSNMSFYVGAEESYHGQNSENDPFLMLAQATEAALPGGSSALSKYMQRHEQLRQIHRNSQPNVKPAVTKSQVRRVSIHSAPSQPNSKQMWAPSVGKVSPSVSKSSRTSSRAVSPMSRVGR